METDSQPPEAGAMSQQHHHARRRAQSRASTASVHSIATQPSLDHGYPVTHHAPFPEQWAPSDHGIMPPARDMSAPARQMGHPMGHAMTNSMSQSMAADDMMVRPPSRLQGPHSFPMDSNMHSNVGSAMPYSQHALPPETYGANVGANASFTDPDSQMLDRDELDEGDSFANAANAAGQKPASTTASRTSANNELEMRQLFSMSRHRSLAEVAGELHGNERGPNSERTRQVFAMLWINQVCSKGRGSVPRGRVYANYASRCATERITVLNPASFGKLVRVLFPGLKTRRLGVRGESKYHYVNFTLAEDQPEIREPAIQPALPIAESASFSQSFSAAHDPSPAPNAERPTLPSPQIPGPVDGFSVSRSGLGKGQGFYVQPDVGNIQELHSSTAKTSMHLAFLPELETSAGQSDTIVLPRIEPFLPDGTDPDSAKSLTALYRSHCTSLVECIRYCKEKTFFHLYTSFQGTLTMPVQRLFSHPSVAPWIEECDFVLYQRMMRILSGLILQVVPPPVLAVLRSISERLVPHIRTSFSGQPRHVVQAKEASATIFAALLDRSLRVNLTAHAAANSLANPANRDLMYIEWITMVRIRKVAEGVPIRGMDDVVNVLLNEMRYLVNPDPDNVADIERLTLYGDLVAQQNGESVPDDKTPLDRWVQLIHSLPARFPYATAAEVVLGVQRVGTAVMRDITVAGGKSFGAWWVLKCWADEMISFKAELGGFMQTKRSLPTSSGASRRARTANDAQQPHSRPSTGVEGDLDMSQISQPQPDRAPLPQLDGPESLHSANHDDSGIGIRTPEEDFPMDKFEFQHQQQGPLQPGPGQVLQSLGT